MRRILGLALIGLLALSVTASAANLKKFQPGPRLIDGTQLNTIVDFVNGFVGGTTALTGTNPKTVTVQLTSIAHCNLTLVASTAPTTTELSYTVSGAVLSIYEWMPTTISNNTLIQSSGTETVSYRCYGTR